MAENSPLGSDRLPLKDHQRRALSFMSFLEGLSVKYEPNGITIKPINHLMHDSDFSNRISKQFLKRPGLSESEFQKYLDRIGETKRIEEAESKISVDISGMNKNLVYTVSEVVRKHAVEKLRAIQEYSQTFDAEDDDVINLISQTYKFED